MSVRVPTLVFAVFTAFLATGCPPVEDIDPIDDTPVDPIDSDIVGDWVSEGADVAPLLAANDVVRVDASFMDDGTYVVTSTDSQGAEIDFSGTFTLDETTSPAGIVLEQTSPYGATARGIWEYDGSMMRYEVVQDGLGFTAPSSDSGFGSTSGPGLEAGWNIQTFR
ncbi:MAG: hypothetical protein H6737_11560 [Alphaproteobacteria bacterium]|nr:hypothetical protein [Alphaproteobacteria bacterium]